jgi:general secretion pathway protein H
VKIRTSPTGNTSHRGFTLLEILVVLTIMGLVSLIAVPIYSSLLPRMRVMGAARDLAVELRHARSEAIRLKTTLSVKFDPGKNSYVFAGTIFRPDAAMAAAVGAGAELSNANPQMLKFYPDGSVNPATIVFSSGSMAAKVQTDWLTGRVRIDGEK